MPRAFQDLCRWDSLGVLWLGRGSRRVTWQASRSFSLPSTATGRPEWHCWRADLDRFLFTSGKGQCQVLGSPLGLRNLCEPFACASYSKVLGLQHRRWPGGAAIFWQVCPSLPHAGTQDGHPTPSTALRHVAGSPPGQPHLSSWDIHCFQHQQALLTDVVTACSLGWS